MKKIKLLLCFLIVGIVDVAVAQTTTVSGTVKDETGNFLHYAFVQEIGGKDGVYTDSLGNFSLQAQANATLAINCAGFKDASAQVNGANALNVIMHSNGAGGAKAYNAVSATEGNNAILQATVRDQINLSNAPGQVAPSFTQGATMTAIHTKTETQGSPYMFKTWVHGYVVNSMDSLVQNAIFLFNYDKMTGNLLLTKDRQTVIAINKDKIKSFTLFDAVNQPLTFVMVPDIDKTHYVEVITNGKNYKIYKQVHTKFVPSNYSNDGIASTGNTYDEYQDEDTYFVQDAKTNQVQKLALRKKAIKQAFGSEQARVDKYFADNNGDIDDNFLRDLGDYMNK